MLQATADPAVVRQLETLEEQLTSTWKNRDCAGWGGLLADDWTVTHINAQVITKAQGLEMDDEPYEFVVGTKTLVRGDFQKDVGTRVMRQSTLVMLARGYVVSFTFIGGTEDEVEELVQGLSFAMPRAK